MLLKFISLAQIHSHLCLRSLSVFMFIFMFYFYSSNYVCILILIFIFTNLIKTQTSVELDSRELLYSISQ